MKRILLGVLSLASASGAGAYALGGGENQTWLSPSLGEQQVVTAGDTMVQARGVFVPEMVMLLEQPQQPEKLKTPVKFEKGDLLMRVDTSRALKACLKPPADPLSTVWESCLIDDDGDGTFDRMATSDVGGAKAMPSPIAYEIVLVQELAKDAGLTRRLIYQGVSSGELKLSYREFNDNMARDAFTEDLSIPIGNALPQQFAVKGLRLTAHNVGPLGLEYSLDQVEPLSGWGTRPQSQ